MKLNKLQEEIQEACINGGVVHVHAAPATGKTAAAVQIAKCLLKEGKKVAFLGEPAPLIRRVVEDAFKGEVSWPTVMGVNRFIDSYRDRYALIVVDDADITPRQKNTLRAFTELLLILDCDTAKVTHLYSDSPPFWDLETGKYLGGGQ